MTPLHFEPVGPDLSTIWPLYESAFPWVERRSEEGLKRVLGRPGFRLERVVDSGTRTPLGLIAWWRFDDFIFIEHIAVYPDLRGQGYGAWIIASLPTPLVLETEIPHDVDSARRLAFYERLGFGVWSYDYYQPSYHEGLDPVPMRLLGLGTDPSKEAFERYVTQIHTAVYDRPRQG